MIHPIQSFKQMSTGKKVATVVGTAAAAAAIASVPVAFIKGGKIVNADTFVGPKLNGAKGAFDKLKKGYAEIGHAIAETAKKINPFKGKGKEAPAPAAE